MSGRRILIVLAAAVAVVGALVLCGEVATWMDEDIADAAAAD